MKDLELKDALKSAVRATLDQIQRAHPDERMNAYALCTDDDLMTVFHVATTAEFCEGVADPEIRFLPVDWTYDEGAELLDGVNEELVVRYRAASDHERHVEGSFQVLVDALMELRAEGAFAPEVVLIVTSTDPGPKLEALADAAVRDLNDSKTYLEWKEGMGLDLE